MQQRAGRYLLQQPGRGQAKRELAICRQQVILLFQRQFGQEEVQLWGSLLIRSREMIVCVGQVMSRLLYMWPWGQGPSDSCCANTQKQNLFKNAENILLCVCWHEDFRKYKIPIFSLGAYLLPICILYTKYQ